jgi:soluble cytochrome b562
MVAGGQGDFRHTFSNMRDPLKFQAIAGSAASEIGEVEVVEAPALGNFRIRYQYPDYTRLPSKTEEGTGHIETLAGSEVRLEMAATKPIAHGQVIFDDHTQLPLTVRQDGLLQATAIITKPGGYRVEVQDDLGFTNQDNLSYRIDIIPDVAPQIDLLAPEAELEIDEGRVITLEYEARDDFGLKELALVYRAGPLGEKRLVIDRIDEVAKHYQGRYFWDVTDLFSGAREEVTYTLEVWDNDTVSGPKRGVSATHVLRIKGHEEEHRRLDEMQQQVAEKLVDLLADQLELNLRTADLAQRAVPPQPTAVKEVETRQAELQQQAQDLVSQLDHMLQLLEQDYLSDYTRYEDTQTLRQNLHFTQETLMEGARRQLSQPSGPAPSSTPPTPTPRKTDRQQPGDVQPAIDQAMARQEAAQGELERMAMFAQEIGKRAKMRDVENLAQRMTRTQKNLFDALTDLDKLGKDMDAATREALARELDALEKAMQALMEALSKLPSELPDEFLNSEALQNLELGDLMQTLQQLREQLQHGNLSEAKRLAEDLLRSLNQMLAALQSAQRFAQSMPFGQQQSGMERAQNELEQIMREQSEVLRDTTGIDKSVRQRLAERQRQDFEQLQQQLSEEIANAQRQLQEAARTPHTDTRRSRQQTSAMNRLDRALDRITQHLTPEESGDLLRALQGAAQELSAMQQQASPAVEELLRHHPELQTMLQDLRNLLAESSQRLAQLNGMDGRELLDPEQGEELGQLSQRQHAVRERTEALKSRLDQMAPFMPFLGPELRQHIGEAGEFMGEAQGKLRDRQARRAVPPEEEALRRLSQGQQAMQQAMQQMAQRGQMGQIPVPMVLRRPGDPFAFNQQPFPERSPRDQGRMGVNTRDFKIPGKEEYKAPKQFREEILEALKRGGPSQFKGQIEQYFKNLTE